TINITQPAVLTATASAPPVACYGDLVNVTINGSGGTAPYTGTVISGVSAGTYTYTITDLNNCSADATITISQPALLTATATAPTILCNGDLVNVTINAAGGTAPYSGTVITGVAAGNYLYNV